MTRALWLFGVDSIVSYATATTAWRTERRATSRSRPDQRRPRTSPRRIPRHGREAPDCPQAIGAHVIEEAAELVRLPCLDRVGAASGGTRRFRSVGHIPGHQPRVDRVLECLVDGGVDVADGLGAQRSATVLVGSELAV